MPGNPKAGDVCYVVIECFASRHKALGFNLDTVKIIKLPDRWYLHTDITTEKKVSADFNKDNLQVKECFKHTALR